MSKYPEDKVLEWKERYPEIWAEFNACETRKQLNALRRKYRKLMDEDYNVLCDGAYDAFSIEIREATENFNPISLEEHRMRCLTGITQSDGRRCARKWN